MWYVDAFVYKYHIEHNKQIPICVVAWRKKKHRLGPSKLKGQKINFHKTLRNSVS